MLQMNRDSDTGSEGSVPAFVRKTGGARGVLQAPANDTELTSPQQLSNSLALPQFSSSVRSWQRRLGTSSSLRQDGQHSFFTERFAARRVGDPERCATSDSDTCESQLGQPRPLGQPCPRIVLVGGGVAIK